jgi:hypothetical protein
MGEEEELFTDLQVAGDYAMGGLQVSPLHGNVARHLEGCFRLISEDLSRIQAM